MYQVYLVETISGQVGKRLDDSALSWTDTLNGIGQGSVTVTKKELKQIERRRYAIDAGSILVTYTYDGVEKPWFAGPISGWPPETEDTFQLDFTGIRGLLLDRLALKNDSFTKKQDVKVSGLSLGTIAQEMVANAQDRPGGSLPIVYRTPRETGTHQRTWNAYNVANLTVDKLLTELTEVENGPDIAFRPEWRDESKTHIVWGMYNGTNNQYTIPQTFVAIFDTTSKNTGVFDLTIDTLGSERTSRVYATGEGQDAATKMAMVEDQKMLQDYYPFKETVISDTSEKDVNRLKSYASEHLRANLDVIHELSFGIRANDPRYPLGQSWNVGDVVKVYIKDNIKIPDGEHLMVITEASGDQTDNIKLKLREE